MDANKREQLYNIGYKIEPTCRTCKYFKQGTDKRFGDCQAFTYNHQKHNAGVRQLSVHQSGKCENFELDSKEKAMMHGFSEFLILDFEETGGEDD